MRDALPPSLTSSQSGKPAEFNGSALQGMLQHVPIMELPRDGDFAQPIGVDLPAVVINLARRPDKLETLRRRMAEVGLNKIMRAPAIEGAQLPPGQIAPLLRSPGDATFAGPNSHFTLTPPAIGCFLSHLAVWRWMLSAGFPRLLVFEDDASPVADFSADRFHRILAAEPAATGLVFLGCIIMNGLADSPQGGELARLYYFNGTHAYLITRAAAQALLEKLLPLHAHIDHQISKVLMEQRHHFPAYYAAPLLFDPDWAQGSDCYVALSNESGADRELGGILATSRRALLDEGRPLLPEYRG
jgi:GR25 family glycosyltransferase involved in LPS biosynthesis